MEFPLLAKKGCLFYTTIDAADFNALNASRWTVNADGYAMATTGPAKGFSMQIFLMQPPPGMIVHHKNEDRLDNRRLNLENVSHSAHALVHRPRGERHKDVTLPIEHYLEIKAIGRSMPQREVARAYGTSACIVGLIVNGKYWRDKI